MSGATQQTGVQNLTQDPNDPKAQDDAEARAKSAPLRGVMDLPEDHPLRRRAEMFEQVEQATASREGIDPDADQDDAAAEAERQRLAQTAAPVTDTATTTAAPAAAPAAQGDELILTPEMLARAMVVVKVDGNEEKLPASKVLSQYQKGAAADVRLAEATRLRNEAKEAADKVQRDAQAAPATASPSRDAVPAELAEAAKTKFKEASAALYDGDQDKASQLFAEATTIALSGSQGRSNATPTPVDTRTIAKQVRDELSQESALMKLFEDYPEIKQKRAFAILADEYTNAFLSQGASVAEAIAKAGEALGEEYGIGKYKPQPAAQPLGRPLASKATTQADKLSAKEELDAIQSGAARAVTATEQEQTPQQLIAELQASRAAGMADNYTGRRQRA